MVPFTLTLRESSREPMHRQLYRELREAVLNGRLPPGSRLPSTRAMASELGVSRNTVMGAFDQLLAEGYLEGKVGSGTYVARKTARGNAACAAAACKARRRARPVGAALSQRGAVLASSPVIPPRPHRAPRAFRPGPGAARSLSHPRLDAPADQALARTYARDALLRRISRIPAAARGHRGLRARRARGALRRIAGGGRLGLAAGTRHRGAAAARSRRPRVDRGSRLPGRARRSARRGRRVSCPCPSMARGSWSRPASRASRRPAWSTSRPRTSSPWA